VKPIGMFVCVISSALIAAAVLGAPAIEVYPDVNAEKVYIDVWLSATPACNTKPASNTTMRNSFFIL
jgi:hypothetical protein